MMGLSKAWVIRIFLFTAASIFSYATHAEPQTISAKDDYVTCWKQPCVYSEGSKWSEKNPNGVALSVRMGTKSIATDDQIKEIFTSDFAFYGIKNIKFFYEQNDAPATGIAFHIRGGTEGLFLLLEAKNEVSKIAKRAANKNPVFKPS